MVLLIGYELATGFALGWKYHLIWRMPYDVAHGSESLPGGQCPSERGSLSPCSLMCQWLSTTACARTMLSAMPHLHAAHWMISSVVPVKSPVMRVSYLSFHVESNAVLFARCTGPSGLAWFWASLSGRGSHGERCTRAAHSASVGSAEPGGSVLKYPASGTGDVRCLRDISASAPAATTNATATASTSTRRVDEPATAGSGEVAVEDLAAAPADLVGHVLARQQRGQLAEDRHELGLDRVRPAGRGVLQHGDAPLLGRELPLVRHEPGLVEVAHAPVVREAAARTALAEALPREELVGAHDRPFEDRGAELVVPHVVPHEIERRRDHVALVLRKAHDDGVHRRELLPDVLEERDRLREQTVLVLAGAYVEVVVGAHIVDVGAEPRRHPVSLRGADVLAGAPVERGEQRVFVLVEIGLVPRELVDVLESRVVAGRLRIEHLQLHRQAAVDERVDELVPLLVGVDDRVEVVAERHADQPLPADVVELGVREAADRAAAVVDDDARRQVEAIGVDDRGEPRRRAEAAALRAVHQLGPRGIVEGGDGANGHRRRRNGSGSGSTSTRRLAAATRSSTVRSSGSRRIAMRRW